MCQSALFCSVRFQLHRSRGQSYHEDPAARLKRLIDFILDTSNLSLQLCPFTHTFSLTICTVCLLSIYTNFSTDDDNLLYTLGRH